MFIWMNRKGAITCGNVLIIKKKDYYLNGIGISLESFQIHVSIYDIFPYNLVYISINTNPVFMQGSFFLLIYLIKSNLSRL